MRAGVNLRFPTKECGGLSDIRLAFPRIIWSVLNNLKFSRRVHHLGLQEYMQGVVLY